MPGIYANNDVLVDADADVTGSDSDSHNGNTGIQASGNITISGGNVNITGGDSGALNGGVACAASGDIEITGGTVTAKGGNGDTDDSGGAYAHGAHGLMSYEGDISISNGANVTAIGGDGGDGGAGNMGGVGVRAINQVFNDPNWENQGGTVTISSNAGDVYIRGGIGNGGVRRDAIMADKAYVATGNVGTIAFEAAAVNRELKNTPNGDDVYMLTVNTNPAAATTITSNVATTVAGLSPFYTYKAPTLADGVAYMWLPVGNQTVSASGYNYGTGNVNTNNDAEITLTRAAGVLPPVTPGDPNKPGDNTNPGGEIKLPGNSELITPPGNPPIPRDEGGIELPGGGELDLPPGTVITPGGEIRPPYGGAIGVTFPNDIYLETDSVLILDGDVPLGFYPMFINPFDDVHESDWFYDNVVFVYVYGLMTGVTDSMFYPDAPMTRAMLVTVLWRLAGSPAAGTDVGFEDVVVGAWYWKAVCWAAENGIVEGIGDNLVAPDTYISRQDIAVVLARYAGYAGLTLPDTRDYAGFADEDEIAGYARAALEALYKCGIINGRTGNLLDPAGYASRAEVAAMMQRFVETAE